MRMIGTEVQFTSHEICNTRRATIEGEPAINLEKKYNEDDKDLQWGNIDRTVKIQKQHRKKYGEMKESRSEREVQIDVREEWHGKKRLYWFYS